MRKHHIALIFFAIVFSICSAFVSLKCHGKSSGGITGRNGSPGEGTCSGCHSGGSTSTSVSINAVPAFTNNEYVQGQTYTITVTVAGAAYTKFGFSSEILFTPSNTNAGTMANPGAGVSLANGPSGRKNAIQNSTKTGAGTADFTFEWTAPTNGFNVTIYAVGNCVNGNGSTSGDFARATSLTLTTPTVTNLAGNETQTLRGFELFPNPAQSNINVSYGLTENTNVCIQLCSITGEIVAELLNEQQEPGPYSKKLDIPLSVTKGLYFLKVNGNSKIVAQRLVGIR